MLTSKAVDGRKAGGRGSTVAIYGAILLSLSGCATTQYATTSCITLADYQKLAAAEPPKVKGKLTGQADADIRPITGSAIELRAWGHALLDTLHVCANVKSSIAGN